MKTYKAVIFDLFDTLVDFDRTQIPTVTIDGREIRSTAGKRIRSWRNMHRTRPLTRITRCSAPSRRNCWPYESAIISKSRRAVAMKCSAIVSGCRGMRRRTLHRWHASHASSLHARLHGLSPRTHPGVEALKARYALGLLSNFDSAETGLKILATHGLRPYFSPIHISEAIGYRKPRREAFLQQRRP